VQCRLLLGSTKQLSVTVIKKWNCYLLKVWTVYRCFYVSVHLTL